MASGVNFYDTLMVCTQCVDGVLLESIVLAS